VRAEENFVCRGALVPADEAMSRGENKALVDDGSIAELPVSAKADVREHRNVRMRALFRYNATNDSYHAVHDALWCSGIVVAFSRRQIVVLAIHVRFECRVASATISDSAADSRVSSVLAASKNLARASSGFLVLRASESSRALLFAVGAGHDASVDGLAAESSSLLRSAVALAPFLPFLPFDAVRIFAPVSKHKCWLGVNLATLFRLDVGSFEFLQTSRLFQSFVGDLSLTNSPTLGCLTESIAGSPLAPVAPRETMSVLSCGCSKARRSGQSKAK